MVYVQKTNDRQPEIQTIQSKKSMTSLKINPSVSVDMQYYQGSEQSYSPQSSGAYVFRPDTTGRHSITNEPTITEVNGPLVNETIYTLDDWAVMTTRTYADSDITEVTWQVGPISEGKEVVMVYKSELQAEDFYTDANGRQMIRRVFTSDTEEDIAANYYPITTRLELRSEGDKGGLTVITDRSQGGSSLTTGELELMVHRQCLKDDGFGVGEALMEQAFGVGLVARGQHFVLSDAGYSLSEARLVQQEKVLTAQLSFLSTSMSLDQWIQTQFTPHSGLNVQLPDSVQILTLSKWKSDDQVLIRFQHILAKVCNCLRQYSLSKIIYRMKEEGQN